MINLEGDGEKGLHVKSPERQVSQQLSPNDPGDISTDECLGEVEDSVDVSVTAKDWCQSPDFEWRWSKDLWNPGLGEFQPTDFSFLRNNSLTVNRLRSVPLSRALASFKSVRGISSIVKHNTIENSERENQTPLDIIVYENGSYVTIGKIEIHKSVYGEMVIAKLTRNIPGSLLQISFAVDHQSRGTTGAHGGMTDLNLWQTIPLHKLPSFKNCLTLSIKYFASKEYNTIVDISPFYPMEKKFLDGGCTSFKILPYSLTELLPLKRQVEINVYHSLAFKEVCFKITSCITTANLYWTRSATARNSKLNIQLSLMQRLTAQSMIIISKFPCDHSFRICRWQMDQLLEQNYF